MIRGHYTGSVRERVRSRHLAVLELVDRLSARQKELVSENTLITESIQDDAMLYALVEMIYNRTK